jgi:hypothetical protein
MEWSRDLVEVASSRRNAGGDAEVMQSKAEDKPTKVYKAITLYKQTRRQSTLCIAPLQLRNDSPSWEGQLTYCHEDWS